MSLFRKRQPSELDRTVELMEDVGALSDEELERLVVPRLTLGSDVPASMHPNAQPFVHGLYVLIAVKLRLGRTVVPPESFWQVRGGFQRWRSVALANLSRLFDDPETEYRRVPTDGVVLSSFMGLSRDLAGLVLRFADLMAHLGVEDPGSGFLVAVPQRQQIFWHAIEGNETPEFTRRLASIALSIFHDTESGLRVSPLVYWVRGDEWKAVTVLRGDMLGFVPSPELVAALGQSG